MIFQTFQSRRTPSTRARRTPAPRYHLTMEGLEERTVMSAAAVAHIAQPAAQVAPVPSAAVSLAAPIHITGINVTRIVHAGQNLTGAVATVTGTIAGQAFKTTATITGSPGATAATQVLNLHLAPINLNLLGLEVKTSEICLNISAQPGAGNLLGNLVSGLAGALDGVKGGGTGLLTTLNGLLGTVGAAKTNNVNTALNSLLSTVTTGAAGTTGSSSVLGLLNNLLGSMTPSAPTGAQNILHLSVGPVNLNLLGLVVALNNCATPAGPVTVDINAIPGKGNLLGNLLVGLSHALDPSAIASFDQALLTALGNLKV